MKGPEVYAAIIAAFTSLLLALISVLQSARQRKKLNEQQILIENLRKESASSLESIRHDFTIKKSILDARLDYEYEAKKKLYSEYEPLFFQFTEFSTLALNHIKGISWVTFHSVQDSEKWNKEIWMDRSSYYFRETVYKLFCPLAILKLINERLNTVDVRMDSKILIVYKIGKILCSSFQHDYIIAQKMSNSVKVDKEHVDKFGEGFKLGAPFNQSYYDEWQKKIVINPEEFEGGEGIRTGQFDSILNELIDQREGKGRVISFNEFESKLTDDKSADWLKILELRFAKFDPKVNKILWRLLVIQACLHSIIRKIKDLEEVTPQLVEDFAKEFIARARRDIKDKYKAGLSGNVTNEDEQEDILNTVENYIRKGISDLK